MRPGIVNRKSEIEGSRAMGIDSRFPIFDFRLG
jgi:hypothetical protein